MKKLVDYFIGSIILRPWLYLLFGIVLLFVTLPGLLRMTSDFSYRGYYRPDHPLIKNFEKFEKEFGGDDRIAVVISGDRDIFAPEGIQLINELTNEMWKVDGMLRVDSLTNYNWIQGHGDELEVLPFIDLDENKLSTEFLEEKRKDLWQDYWSP